MRRILNISLVLFCMLCLIVSCSTNKNDKPQEKNRLKIGVTSIPHGEILQNIRNIYDLDFEIINYVDYRQLNEDLINKKLDANFFQTRDNMEYFNSNSQVKLVELAGVHIEPMIIYSSKYKSISNVEDGDVVYIPNDFVNRNRALKFLQESGLIKLSDDFNTGSYSIIENPKNLIINEVLASEIPNFYQTADLIVLNTNIALENNIIPKDDGIFYENSFTDSGKVNVFVTREDMKTSVDLKQIASYLTSFDTFKFINEKYYGFVKPVF